MTATKSSKNLILAGLTLVALAGACLWSASQYLAARRQAQAAADDLAQCHRLARQYRALRQASASSAGQQSRDLELSKQVEQLARRAKIPSGGVVSIDPGSLRRVGETPYMEKPTEVRLAQASLEQLMTLLHGLCEDGPGVDTRSIRLIAPRESAAEGQWRAEITLTYLVYQPPTAVGAARN